MYVCHEKVTPSWIVGDDDIYMAKLEQPVVCTPASRGQSTSSILLKARTDDDHFKFL